MLREIWGAVWIKINRKMGKREVVVEWEIGRM